MDKHRPADTSPPAPTFYYPCPICSTLLDVRLSKKGRPYLTCDDCGMQLFVRTDEGVKRFEKLVRTEDGRPASEVVTSRAAPSSTPKRRPGRPRKNAAVAQAVERAVQVVSERQGLGPLSVIGTGR